MKELSIEEKAKRYDEAIEKAIKLKKDPQSVFYEYSPNEGDTICDYIFPELKELDDEGIRKKLLSSFKGIMADADEDELWYGLPYNDIIAWLEKQGQTFTKKDVDDAYLKGICDAKQELEKQCDHRPADKVEPKFHEGEWITFKE